MKRILTSLAVALALTLSGCGSSGSDSPTQGSPGAGVIPAPSGPLISLASIETAGPTQVLNSNLQAFEFLGKAVDRSDGIGDDAADAVLLNQVWDAVKVALTPYLRYFVTSYRVTYTTQDAQGRSQTVSGLMVVPFSISGGTVTCPLLSLQHPTQVENRYAPSMQNLADNEFTYQTALLLATTGYIVVVADYPGLGVNRDPHPYCHASLANCVVDLVDASLNSAPLQSGGRCRWSGESYLMGYSEGGYATMIAARQLQQSGRFNLKGAAALDGPYSLSQTMRQVILTADANYASPYFLPLMLNGYDAVYAGTKPEFAFESAVKTSVPGYQPPGDSNYARELRKLLDGSHSSDEIDNHMKLVSPYLGPRSILTGTFLGYLGDDQSTVIRTVAENDGFRGWTPQVRFKMFHNRLDDLVPVENMRQAASNFQPSSQWSSEEFVSFIPGLGSIHAGAMPVAYGLGFQWLDQLAYPARH